MHSTARRFAVPFAAILLATAALALGTAWKTSAAPAQDPAAEPAGEHQDDSPLHAAMELMNASQRKINRALKSGDGPTALGALAEFQTNVIAAKSQVPPRAAEFSGEEQQKFVAAFRSTLVDLLRVTCDLEQALIAGRLEEAQKVFVEKLRPMEDKGHARFAEEHEDN